MKIKNNVLAESFIGKLFFRFYKNRKFTASDDYWEERYSKGKNSGAGSYNELARFKAEVLNGFVQKQNIRSVIEFGCGDGNQLQLANYPKYIGLDVSKTTIQNCIGRFAGDPTKSFFLYNSHSFADKHQVFRAELALSLDVIYHLIEDWVFEAYMSHLFGAAEKYVIIYSSNSDSQQLFHVKQRKFTNWIDSNCPNWEFVEIIKNKYPYNPKDPSNTSFADFYVYRKI